MLIGASTFSDYPELPAVANNLADLQSALTVEGGAFTSDNCSVIVDPRTPGDIGPVILRAAAEATDTLLVYYAGHGQPDSSGRLHLALTTSHPDQVQWSALHIDVLLTAIRESPARARILILDCCYSGRALAVMSDESAAVGNAIHIAGAYTIASSAPNAPSLAPPGDRHTAFTAALLDTARSNRGISLDKLFTTVQRKLRNTGHPEPHRNSSDSAGRLVLFPRTDSDRESRAAPWQTTVSPIPDLSSSVQPIGSVGDVRSIPRFGGRIHATVTGVDAKGIAVVSSSGLTGIISGNEIDAAKPSDPRGRIDPGAVVVARFLKLTDDETFAELSLRRHECEEKWPEMIERHRRRDIVRGRVLHHGVNGLHLAVEDHVRGFVPWVHAQLHDTDPTPAVGTVVAARIRKLDRGLHRLLLSRRHVIDLGPVRHASYGDEHADYAAEAARAASLLQTACGPHVRLPSMLGSGLGCFVTLEDLCEWVPMLSRKELGSLGRVLSRAGGPAANSVSRIDLEQMLVRLERARRKLAQLPVVVRA
nr:caspase family protein [Nocardia sp. AG03]